MTILVTGAAGFVGLAVVEHLLARGDRVIAADITPLPDRAAAEFERLPGELAGTPALDVTDAAAFAALVAAERPRAIVHLAALTPLAAVTPALAIRLACVNIGGALNAVAAAAASATPFLVHASSGAVFGKAGFDKPILDASVRPAPSSAYGMAKLAGESMLALVAEQAGVATAVVRLASVFGRWERATGARPVPSPLARVTEAAIAGQAVVIADDLPRDWIYSMDVAAGIASLLDHARHVPAPLHLSSGLTWSLKEWCERLAERVEGFNWRFDAGDKDAIGTPNSRAPLETEALAALTGFRARFDMARAMNDYLSWRQPG